MLSSTTHRSSVITILALFTIVATVVGAAGLASANQPRPRPMMRLPDARLAPAVKLESRSPSTSSPTAQGAVNLNTATTVELESLPGIGPKKAERIVDYRKKQGLFKRVVDLRRVKGFGPKTVRKLEPYLKLSGQSDYRP